MAKYIGALLTFLVCYFFRVIFILLGLVVVPVAYLFRKGDRFPGIFWLWSNDEDGIFGPSWFHRGTKNFFTCYKWSAIRNPANNMRFIDLFSVRYHPSIMYQIKGWEETPTPGLSRQFQSSIWHLTLVKQKGFYYPSFWYIKALTKDRHFRIRIGWKCSPDWLIDRNEQSKHEVGLTFQFLPYRRG